jgi:hypothetical protein
MTAFMFDIATVLLIGVSGGLGVGLAGGFKVKIIFH